MPIRKIFVSVFAALGLNAAAHADVVWTDWTSATLGSLGSAAGTLSLASGDVRVDYSGGVYVTTQVSGGTHYWSPSAPYISEQVPSAPPPSDIITLRGGDPLVSTYRVTFSRPVVDPVMAVLSLGRTNLPVRYRFDQPFTILSQGRGYFGGCDTCLSNPEGNVLLGTEGHGVIRFEGTFTELTWSVPDEENWHGFTIGVSPVPEPESYALLAGGLSALAIARRRKTR